MKPADREPQKQVPGSGIALAGASEGNTIDSRLLLNGRATVDIAHQGELYRLRLTRQGKLILTK